MKGRAIFLTHGEVEIDPDVPVPDWGLNEVGRRRHEGFARSDLAGKVTSVFSSVEQKARDAAAPVAARLGLDVQCVTDLGENDRSATGYLPADEFWGVVERFFAEPDTSVRGWETARAAQDRIVRTVRNCLSHAPEGTPLFVAHGGVATLLRCRLINTEISKSQGQPHPGGGCWFAFDRAMDKAPTEWSAI